MQTRLQALLGLNLWSLPREDRNLQLLAGGCAHTEAAGLQLAVTAGTHGVEACLGTTAALAAQVACEPGWRPVPTHQAVAPTGGQGRWPHSTSRALTLWLNP